MPIDLPIKAKGNFWVHDVSWPHQRVGLFFKLESLLDLAKRAGQMPFGDRRTFGFI